MGRGNKGVRYQVVLAPEIAEVVEMMCKHFRLSKSSVLAMAVEQYVEDPSDFVWLIEGRLKQQQEALMEMAAAAKKAGKGKGKE